MAKSPAEGRTAYEHFEFLWDTHGHGSAKSWAKAYMGPEIAALFVRRKTGKLPQSLTEADPDGRMVL